MDSKELSDCLKSPSHFFPQLIFTTSLSYVGVACFTSIPPLKGATFMGLTHTISRYAAPLFVTLFEPHRHVALVPAVGQILQLSCSLILAKTICSLIKQPLSLKEAKQVCAAFLTAQIIYRIAYKYFFRLK